MVIDSRHAKWLVGTVLGAVFAVALYLWLGRNEADGLTGGSRVGLSYGIAGGLLILFAWSLSLLRHVPSWWWLGSRSFWLKGHIYLGSLSAVLILCHAGGRFGGPLERVLWTIFALTLLTGYVGLWLQNILPRRLTERVSCEVPYEQLPQVCAKMQVQADELFDTMAKAGLLPTIDTELGNWYAELVRPFLGWPERGNLLRDAARTAEVFAQVRALPGVSTASGSSPAEASLARLEFLCAERRDLVEQERLQRLLHGWLFLHVPLSAALLVLGLAHMMMTLYY